MPGSTTDIKRLDAKKILVAEDVELNQHLAKHILEARGAAVAIANNGNEALQLVRDNSFDCILMDVQMPEMDGIRATQCIRQLSDPMKASVPIIALTANVHRDDIQKYKAAGMNDYLAKPFDESGLLLVILRNQLYMGNAKESQSHVDTSGQKLYDLSMIQSMSGGDGGFIKKMIRLFIETVPQNVNELTTAVSTQNWEQTSKMAHKLKSTVDSMGIKSIHADIRLVESNAKQQQDLAQIPPLVFKIETVIHDCIQQLKKIAD
ncbi:MAG: response regulator [Bacteroidetes bacterium]|nr:response regulator [Bacteroidota bacterium]